MFVQVGVTRMNEAFRQMVIDRLERGEALPLEWKRELFPPEKREYELVYYGKEREEDILAETMAVPLQAIRAFGGNGVDWHNLLIFGDNLQAMKTLLKMKEQGQLVNADGSQGIKLVYIDPPFATKQEFQGGSQEARAYQDKVVGAEFVEFIRKRLVLIRELLTTNGSLFVHLDQRKAHYIKAILDEVFEEHNFRNEIMLPGRASKNLQQQFETISRLNVRHDTLLWYSRSGATRFAPVWVEKHKAGNPEGHWHHFWSTADRPSMRYELFRVTPTTGQWTWKEERAKRAVANYKRYVKEAGGRTLAEYWRDTGCALEFVRKDPDDGKPQYWRAPAEMRLADTVWAGIPVYSNSSKYPTEKSEALLKQVVELASEKGDIVLDAFAGSGTTLAVAEKLGRRWVGIDCGKLAIYTIQKRLLNLKTEIGNSRGRRVMPRPFTLYNAGLYDFARLKDLPWDHWRSYALALFQCQDKPHDVAGIPLDGYRNGDDVLVFNHRLEGGVVLDYGFIDDLHSQVGSRIGARFFIIAPAASVTFLEDYVERGRTQYYVLRIPYSIINELHNRNFEALTQPVDQAEVNNLVEAVGFDFIRPPKVQCTYSIRQRPGEMFREAVIKINTFKSQAMTKGASLKGNRETLSAVLVDYDYPLTERDAKEPPPFELDAVFYSTEMQSTGWEVCLPLDSLGEHVMIIYLDIYGNEHVEIKSSIDFGDERSTASPKHRRQS
jgi:site-specific DNA-methyltransferase (adenine-specific)/adenine-specific DNA-methyltransferase